MKNEMWNAEYRAIFLDMNTSTDLNDIKRVLVLLTYNDVDKHTLNLMITLLFDKNCQAIKPAFWLLLQFKQFNSYVHEISSLESKMDEIKSVFSFSIVDEDTEVISFGIRNIYPTPYYIYTPQKGWTLNGSPLNFVDFLRDKYANKDIYLISEHAIPML